jgi:hypothetical protein
LIIVFFIPPFSAMHPIRHIAQKSSPANAEWLGQNIARAARPRQFLG